MATQRPQRSDGNREKGTKNPGKRVPGFFECRKNQAVENKNHLHPYAGVVKMSGPFFVMAIVCSYCAE